MVILTGSNHIDAEASVFTKNANNFHCTSSTHTTRVKQTTMTEHNIEIASSNDDSAPHRFDVGYKFKALETHRWKITNRLIDVDTNKPVYLLQGLQGYETSGEQKVIAEETLTNEENGWILIQPETETD